MKLHKKITIGGEPYALNKEDVRLHLFNPGVAVFDVVADAPLSGIASFTAGYDPAALQPVFFGYVENSFAIDKKQQRVFCRELAAGLSMLLPMNLRNVTLNQVLANIADKTGLQFVTPEQAYADKAAPALYSLSSGYHCMDALARVFEIPQYVWQQQGDNKIFVGSWAHSYWQSRPIELPVVYQASSGVANSARIPATPKLRPGVLFNGENFITQVKWDGEHQNITWSKNPWGTRWTNRSSV